MVLISRILSYIVPLVYLLVGLSWLVHSNWVYFGSALVILLLCISIFTITKQTDGFKGFMFELIYPLLTQVISLVFLVFLPKGWLFVLVVVFFTIMQFFILNESFDRHHPFLGKGFDFNSRLQMILIVALVFFMSVIGYNFVLYLNWSLWLVSLVMIGLFAALLLRLQGMGRKVEFLFVDLAVVLLTMELFYIFYYLPVDIYLKGLVVALNLFVIFSFIVNKYFYKITNQYDIKEKTKA